MTCVLLVDDESIVLNGMRVLVPWEEMGITQVFEAADGQKALDLAKSVHPDILITDIRMPEKDGLTLIADVKQLNPDCICIILSGYNDFENARKGITLGAFSYIVKPVVPEELTRTVKDAINLMHRNRYQESMLEAAVSAEPLIKTKFFREILSGKVYKSDSQIKAQMDKKNICFLFPQYLCACFFFQQDGRMASGYSKLVAEMVDKKCDEYGFNRSALLLLENNEGCVCLFGVGQAGDQDTVLSILDCAQALLRDNFGIMLTVVVSNPVYSLMDLSLSYSEIHRIARFKSFTMSPNLYLMSQQEFTQTRSDEMLLFSDELKEQLLTSIVNYDVAGIKEIITNAMIDIGRIGYESKEFFISAMLELIIGLGRGFYKKGIPYEKVFNAQVFSYEFLSGFETIEKLVRWLIDYSVMMASIYQCYKDTNLEWHLIQNVKQYVIKNIEDGISLAKISGEFHYNGKYISRLFKKVEGITLSSFITQERIKRSKDLLQQPQYSIEEIAQRLGFCDSHYFIRVFKECIGTTPNKYRTKQKR